MDRREKHILRSQLSKESVNTNTYINLQINGKEKLLPPDEILKVLDIGEQFNTERQNSTFYRICGKIDPIISNVLFNVTGPNNSWEIFDNPIFKSASLDEDQDLSYAESIKKHLREIDGWYGYFDPVLNNAGLNKFFDMEPKRERFSFVPDTTNIVNNLVKNWELTITYPYASDKTHYLVDGGLLIIEKREAIVGGKEMTALAVPLSHNLLNESTVRLKGTNKDGLYEVKRLGLDNGDFKENYFCIDTDFSSLQIGNNSRFVKVFKDIDCEYYFRKFKKIKTKSTSVIEQDDYEIYKLAFSENIFADAVAQFVFNEDIDVSDLTDNLGRPLSELFLTIVKTDSNDIFTIVASGIESPDISELNSVSSNPHFIDLPIIQKITNQSNSYKPLEANVKIGNNDFYGDIVEYNIATLEETVIAPVKHRFNTINREANGNSIVTGPRPEGYYYNAHSLIRIRDFSTYIEQGTSTTANMPDYKVDLGDGRFIWRDLLDIGATDLKVDVLNYPFVNGCHYLYQNFIFDVKRQDPFDNWDLYHSSFPADPIGNAMDNNFRVNISDDVC